MPFVSDNRSRTTIDVENGMELIPSGGSADGSRYFIINGKNFSIKFSACLSDHETQKETKANNTQPIPDFVWKIDQIAVSGSAHPNSIAEIVSDAMMTYKFAHGYPENKLAAVVICDARFRKH